jgi:hypothetical protein
MEQLSKRNHMVKEGKLDEMNVASDAVLQLLNDHPIIKGMLLVIDGEHQTCSWQQMGTHQTTITVFAS